VKIIPNSVNRTSSFHLQLRTFSPWWTFLEEAVFIILSTHLKNFFILFNLIFLGLSLSCQDKEDWSVLESRPEELSIAEDALVFSSGFSISLIEGIAPIKSVDGGQTSFTWTKKESSLSLVFVGANPEVKLKSHFKGTAIELGKISGRLDADVAPIVDFGEGKGAKLSASVRPSASGSATISIPKNIQFYLPFLFSIQKKGRSTRWRYMDGVELPCDIDHKDQHGWLRKGLPLISISHKALGTHVQMVTSFSPSQSEDSLSLSKKLAAIVKGHSKTSDPRFGNGGFASVGAKSTTLLQPGGSKAEGARLSTSLRCQSEPQFIKGEGGVVNIPGLGLILRHEVLQRIDFSFLKKEALIHFFHLSLQSSLFSDEGEDLTLSKKSALDFADLEIFNEEGGLEVIGSAQYLERISGIAKVKWRWTPKGEVVFQCKGCKKNQELAILLDKKWGVLGLDSSKSFSQKSNANTQEIRWTFDDSQDMGFKIEGARPYAIGWVFK